MVKRPGREDRSSRSRCPPSSAQPLEYPRNASTGIAGEPLAADDGRRCNCHAEIRRGLRMRRRKCLKAPAGAGTSMGRIGGNPDAPDGLQGDWQIEVQIHFRPGLSSSTRMIRSRLTKAGP